MHHHCNAKTNIKQREAIKKSSLSGRGLAKKNGMAERMVRTIKDKIIHLKKAKGKKDKITFFPEKIENDFQGLIAGEMWTNRFLKALFESKRGG